MESLLLEAMYLPKEYSNLILSPALKNTKKRCSRKLHHLQLRCWMDLPVPVCPYAKMQTVEGARGVNYRTLEEPFRIIKEREGIFQYQITVSVLEVYSEQIHDLLPTGSQPGTTAKSCQLG